MRLPRRRPRAVYAVYDAEELLGEHAQPMSDAPLAGEQERSLGDKQGSTPEQGTDWARGRMLIGALLCLTGGCAVIAIALVAPRLGAKREEGSQQPAHRHAESVSVRAHRPMLRRTDLLRRADSAPATVPNAHRGVTRQAIRRGAAEMRSQVLAHALPAPATGSGLPATGPAGMPFQGLASGCDCAAADAEFSFER